MITLPVQLHELEKMFLEPILVDQAPKVRVVSSEIKRNYSKNLACRVYELVIRCGELGLAFPFLLPLQETPSSSTEWNSQFEDACLLSEAGEVLIHTWPFQEKARFIDFSKEAAQTGALLVPIFEPAKRRIFIYKDNFMFMVCVPTCSRLELARNPFVKKKIGATFARVLKNLPLNPSVELPKGLFMNNELYEVQEQEPLLFFQLREAFFSHYGLEASLMKEHAIRRQAGFLFSRWSAEDLYQLLFSKMDRDFFEGTDFLKRSVALHALKLAAIGDWEAARRVEEIYSSEMTWMAHFFHRRFPEKSVKEIEVSVWQIFHNLICGETYSDYLKKLEQARVLKRAKKSHEKLELMNTPRIQKIAAASLAETYEEPGDVIFHQDMNQHLYTFSSSKVNFRAWMFGPKGRPFKGRLYRRLEKFFRPELEESRNTKNSSPSSTVVDNVRDEVGLDFIETARRKEAGKALRERKPKTYEAWDLRRNGERTLKEISSLLGITISATKKRIFEGDLFTQKYLRRFVNSE